MLLFCFQILHAAPFGNFSPPGVSLIFNDGGTHTMDVFASSYDRILVTNNTTVTLNSPNFLFLSIAGDGNSSTPDLQVSSGSTLTLTTESIFFLRYSGSNNTSDLSGTFNLGKSGQTHAVAYQPNNSGQNVTTVTGTINVYNGSRIDSDPASLLFTGTSIYNHYAQHTGHRMPVADWQTGSRTIIRGYTNVAEIPLYFTQTYYDLEWNCPSQTSNVSFAGATPTINGTLKMTSSGSGNLRLNHGSSNVTILCNNFEQTGGNLDLSQGIGNTMLKVSGSFQRTGGTCKKTGSGTATTIEFMGSSQQVVNTGTITDEVDFNINNPSGVSGLITLNTGADLIMTKGSLTNTPVFSGSNGLIYNGSSTQTAGGEWQNVARLTINNPEGVTASNDLIASNSLTLSAGNLALGTATLTLGTSASSPGTYTYTAGRIIGKFKRWISTSVNAWGFHIGTTTNARTVNVAYTSAPVTGGSITVEYLPTNPGTGGLPITANGVTLNDVSPSGHWRATSADGLDGGVYTITLNASEFTLPNGNPITEPAKVRLIKRPTAGNWAPDGTSEAPTSMSALAISGLMSFSEFGAGVEGQPLPVELLHFSASQMGMANRIDWTVAQQLDVAEFLVEKSTDARQWETLDQLPAAGTTDLEMSYSTIDDRPACLSYYRLRSIDLDGSEQRSPTVAVERSCGGDAFVVLYPNPAVSHVNFLWKNTARQDAAYRLTDITGQLLAHGSHVFSPAENLLTLPLDSLSSGLYVLSVFDGKNWRMERFVKR